MSLATVIQLRSDTSASWHAADPTLALGELGYETDTGRHKIGDGNSVYTSLGYNSTLSPMKLPVYDSTNTLPNVTNNVRTLVWFEDLHSPAYSDGTNWYQITGTVI